MIPRIIHYCWYGRGKKDALTERCIASWKKYCPDYRIVEWNEDNCDIAGSVWASEAYSRKKWAFVSDYFRLKAVYENGGVYMDTDVELIRNLDGFLEDEGFVGYADDTYIGSGMFGCVKGSAFCKELLDYYEGRHFIRPDGSLYEVPNNQIYTVLCMKKLGFRLGDDHIACGGVRVYPSDYLSPFKKRTIGDAEKINRPENFDCTDNTAAIHYTVFSWGEQKSLSDKARLALIQSAKSLLPRKLYFRMKRKSKIKEMQQRVELAADGGQ